MKPDKHVDSRLWTRPSWVIFKNRQEGRGVGSPYGPNLGEL
eukprot:COSAG06_NODE_63293_length_262_cov_1.650307_1_plen_40_part_10